MSILVGTDDGLHTLGEQERTDLRGHTVESLVSDGDATWALADGATVYAWGTSGIWRMRARIVPRRSRLPRYDHAPLGTCLHPEPGGGLLVGTEGAHLLRIAADEDWTEKLDSFESVSGRDSWHGPAGDEPTVRSLSVDAQGTVYVNVHIGGIPKSSDGGATWVPTIDPAVEVHQVLADPNGSSAAVYAATAKGPAVSHDGGMSWDYRTDGLAGTYCRAVATTPDHLFVASSSGPEEAEKEVAVYRAQLDEGAFERCEQGLPASLDGAVDAHGLAASGSAVAFGTSDGHVYVSDDSGHTWREEGNGLPAVRCLLIS